jgi:hypothetical protein
MAEYLNAVWSGSPISVPWSDRLNLPGNWVPFKFDTEYADSGGMHTNGSKYFINGGPWFIDGVLDIWFQDFDPLTEIQIRQFEDESDGTRAETGYPHEFYTSSGDNPNYPRTTHHRYPVFSYVNSGHKFGVECSQWAANPNATTGLIIKAQIQARLTS